MNNNKMCKKIRFLVSAITLLMMTTQLCIAQTEVLNDSLLQKIDAHMQKTPFYSKSQIEVNEEEVMKAVDKLPAFGVYKDTYFTTGIPLNKTINRNTADALFQISIRHRVTRSRLPFNSFLYLTYSQKSFWDIYADSAPFRDNNYNPSLGIGRYIIRNNKLEGTAFLQFEHESNGKVEKDSRSWNMMSLSTKYFFNMQLSLGLKVWIPYVDGEHNQDLLNYRGLGIANMNYISRDKRWWLTADINPRKGWGNINTTITAGFKISKNDNQYLYARFFNGKGDSLLDYNKYNMNIRIGVCIKPDFNSIF
jgi:phospholipase A1